MTVLITVTFKKFPSLWLILETKVAKIPIEVRFFKSLASNIERMIGITLIEHINVDFASKILKKRYTSTCNSDSTYNS